MLLSFSLENYLSFRDKQTIYLDKNNTAHSDSLTETYNVVLVIGPNSSGKSNFFKSFIDLKNFIAQKSDDADSRIRSYRPFKLDSSSRTKPTSFKLEFINDSVTYSYEISYVEKRIIYEKLAVENKLKSGVIFERDNNILKEFDNDTFNEYLTLISPNSGLRVYDNQSLLGIFSTFPEAPTEVKVPYDFITKSLICFNEQTEPNISKLTDNLNDDSYQEKMITFLRSIGTGISEISFNDAHDGLTAFNFFFSPTDYIEIIRKDNEGKNVSFNWLQESTGTRELLRYLPDLLECFNSKKVLLLDEIDSNLHYEVIMLIINLFNDKRVNKYQSQLILSSHNLCLLQQEYFDKEQIIFVNKRRDNGSEIYALSDFALSNKDYDIREWYLSGKFDAIPPIDYASVSNAILQDITDISGVTDEN